MKNYYVDPVQLVSTNDGLIRAERLQPELIIKNLQGIHKIVEINKVERIVKQITFKNGWTTYLDLKSYVQSFDNLIPVGQIKPKDWVNFCFFNYFNIEKQTPINWEDRKMAIPIRIPKTLTPEFAYWLGIVSAQSKSSVGHRHIQIELRNKGPLKEIFTQLTKKIFNLTVDEVSEGNRKFLQINSSNLVKFLQHNIGRRLMMFRKVPVFIQEADISLQMEYIRGLSIKGHVDNTKYIVYSGSSKSIAEFVASFLTGIGYGVYRKIKKLGTKKVYNVQVSYCHQNASRIDSDFIQGKFPKIVETDKENPEFSQSYFVSSAPVWEKLNQDKKLSQDLRSELKWKVKILKEQHKFELSKFNKQHKKLKNTNAIEFQSQVSSMKEIQTKEILDLTLKYKVEVESLKSSKRDGYKSILKAKERNQVFISADATNTPSILEDILYIVEVKEVKVLKKEMVEIVVSADSGIMVDGLIIQ